MTTTTTVLDSTSGAMVIASASSSQVTVSSPTPPPTTTDPLELKTQKFVSMTSQGLHRGSTLIAKTIVGAAGVLGAGIKQTARVVNSVIPAAREPLAVDPVARSSIRATFDLTEKAKNITHETIDLAVGVVTDIGRGVGQGVVRGVTSVAQAATASSSSCNNGGNGNNVLALPGPGGEGMAVDSASNAVTTTARDGGATGMEIDTTSSSSSSAMMLATPPLTPTSSNGGPLSPTPSTPNKITNTLKTLGLATIDIVGATIQAVGTVAGSIPEAAQTIVRDGKEAATEIVRHRYGEEAAETAKDALGAVGNVVLVYFDARGVSRRAFLHRAGMEAVSGVLNPPSEEEVKAEKERLMIEAAEAKAREKRLLIEEIEEEEEEEDGEFVDDHMEEDDGDCCLKFKGSSRHTVTNHPLSDVWNKDLLLEKKGGWDKDVDLDLHDESGTTTLLPDATSTPMSTASAYGSALKASPGMQHAQLRQRRSMGSSLSSMRAGGIVERRRRRDAESVA
ncbi:hypothetical protein HK102_003717, partial [Quaeritorhiza haematococci]